LNLGNKHQRIYIHAARRANKQEKLLSMSAAHSSILMWCEKSPTCEVWAHGP
jgi:hypothetical protein